MRPRQPPPRAASARRPSLAAPAVDAARARSGRRRGQAGRSRSSPSSRRGGCASPSCARASQASAPGLLDRYLQRMAAAGLVTRSRYREMPPRVEIELTDAGRELLPAAAALARWALRRAWSLPRAATSASTPRPWCASCRCCSTSARRCPTRPSRSRSTGPGAERRWLLDVRAGVCNPGELGRTRRSPRRSPATPRRGWPRSGRRRTRRGWRCGAIARSRAHCSARSRRGAARDARRRRARCPRRSAARPRRERPRGRPAARSRRRRPLL